MECIVLKIKAFPLFFPQNAQDLHYPQVIYSTVSAAVRRDFTNADTFHLESA